MRATATDVRLSKSISIAVSSRTDRWAAASV